MAKSADQAYGAENRAGGTIMMFDPSKLVVIKDKKDDLYDKRVELPLNEEVVASIMLGGVHKPIVVWKDPETGTVIVLDGKQRMANGLEANKRLVKEKRPVRLIPGTVFKGDRKAALAKMIVLNEGNQEPTASNRAESAKRLLAAGYSEAEVGTILHLKIGTLKNYSALLSCAAVVRAAVDAEDIQPTDAYKLSKLEPAEQKEKLATMLEAAKGVVGKRRRAKKMRVATGEKKTRSKKEILKMIEVLGERFGKKAEATIDLLKWVLGEDPPDLNRPAVSVSAPDAPESKTTNHAPAAEA